MQSSPVARFGDQTRRATRSDTAPSDRVSMYAHVVARTRRARASTGRRRPVSRILGARRKRFGADLRSAIHRRRHARAPTMTDISTKRPERLRCMRLIAWQRAKREQLRRAPHLAVKIDCALRSARGVQHLCVVVTSATGWAVGLRVGAAVEAVPRAASWRGLLVARGLGRPGHACALAGRSTLSRVHGGQRCSS